MAESGLWVWSVTDCPQYNVDGQSQILRVRGDRKTGKFPVQTIVLGGQLSRERRKSKG